MSSNNCATHKRLYSVGGTVLVVVRLNSAVLLQFPREDKKTREELPRPAAISCSMFHWSGRVPEGPEVCNNLLLPNYKLFR